MHNWHLLSMPILAGIHDVMCNLDWSGKSSVQMCVLLNCLIRISVLASRPQFDQTAKLSKATG